MGGLLRQDNTRWHFRNVPKAADLPWMRIYDLRHSNARLLLTAREDLKVVSERLGNGNEFAQLLDGAAPRWLEEYSGTPDPSSVLAVLGAVIAGLLPALRASARLRSAAGARAAAAAKCGKKPK